MAKQPLVNPTWEQMVARDPLVAFSWYLSGRKNVLLDLGHEILMNLDEAFGDAAVKGDHLDRAESLLWLWILGAYEVVRTMDQATECFSDSMQRQFGSVKTELANVRMPAAKMEKHGKKAPVGSNRSPAGWDLSGRDLLVGDPTASSMISARHLIGRFGQVMTSIKAADILARHEDSYAHSPRKAP